MTEESEKPQKKRKPVVMPSCGGRARDRFAIKRRATAIAPEVPEEEPEEETPVPAAPIKKPRLRYTEAGSD